MLERRLRDRYSRQTMFPGIGEEGQVKLLKSRVVIIGCGALGCNIAIFLARAGVGSIKIVDRDFIEYHNLQRQVLFDEEDIKENLPKAIAAERHLRKVNATVAVQGIVADINFTNIEDLSRGADVILDGLDNVETRYLINDVALKQGIPWVYGGAIASTGMTMTIVPDKTPCFRCILPVMPATEAAQTCETVGIVATAPAIIGAIQATEAMKLIIGDPEINPDLFFIDVWRDFFEHIEVKRRPGCPACGGSFEFLGKRFDEKVTSLCGQSRAVQVLDTRINAVSLEKIAGRLGKSAGNVIKRDFMLSFQDGEQSVMVFPDGRAIIKNTLNTSQARQLYDKYVRSNI